MLHLFITFTGEMTEARKFDQPKSLQKLCCDQASVIRGCPNPKFQTAVIASAICCCWNSREKTSAFRFFFSLDFLLQKIGIRFLSIHRTNFIACDIRCKEQNSINPILQTSSVRGNFQNSCKQKRKHLAKKKRAISYNVSGLAQFDFAIRASRER